MSVGTLAAADCCVAVAQTVEAWEFLVHFIINSMSLAGLQGADVDSEQPSKIRAIKQDNKQDKNQVFQEES